MYQAIAQHGRGGAAMQFPPHFSPVACNLIASLLHPDPDQRLGVGPLGIAALKAHPWFEEQRVDWEALMDHRWVQGGRNKETEEEVRREVCG